MFFSLTQQGKTFSSENTQFQVTASLFSCTRPREYIGRGDQVQQWECRETIENNLIAADQQLQKNWWNQATIVNHFARGEQKPVRGNWSQRDIGGAASDFKQKLSRDQPCSAPSSDITGMHVWLKIEKSPALHVMECVCLNKQCLSPVESKSTV